MDEQISWFAGLLDAHAIPYWLDCGTLLGLMREGDLLRRGGRNPDDDIDISMWSTDEPRFRSITPLIREAGYAIRRVSYNRLTVRWYIIAPSQIDPNRPYPRLPIHVHIYRKHGRHAWSPRWYLKRDEQAFIRRVHASTRNTLISTLYGDSERLLLLRRWITIEVCAWPFRLFYDVGTSWVPSFYFERIDRLRDTGVSIPQECQSYLEFRYGDWRTPLEEWNFWLHDGGFQRKTPKEMIGRIDGSTELEERSRSSTVRAQTR